MDLSPEWRLLLTCARAKPTAEELSLIREDLARADLDWDYVAKTACTHGIAPLVYRSLQRSGVASLLLPAPAKRLRGAYYGTAARNALLYHEVHKVLMALREKNIEAIALKGAALAETVYPHRALRPMSDIDLLVRKEKVTEAETKLLDLGYMFQEHGKTKQYYQEHHYHWVFTKRSTISIEIHWHIKRPTDPFRVDIDGLWERAQPVKIAGIDAPVFSLEDLLLHLCQHLWKHKLTGGIRPLCDIAGVTTHYRDKIDWSKMAKTSSEWEMNSCSYLGLWLARELLDAPIPESFLKDLKPVNFNTEFIGWRGKDFSQMEKVPPCSPISCSFSGKAAALGRDGPFCRRYFLPKKLWGTPALVQHQRQPTCTTYASSTY